MSMIGKLRQVSEFDLAKYKKNPNEMMRALAGVQHPGDPARFATLRETLQQSPVVQKMMELSKQQKVLSREQQVEMQQEMMKLMKEAVQMQKAGPAKSAAAEPLSIGSAAREELDLHKSWHCLHFMFTGKMEGSDGTALGDAALAEFPIDKKAQEFDAAAADRAGIYVAQHEAGELTEYFGQLRSFYQDAARKGNALLLWIE